MNSKRIKTRKNFRDLQQFKKKVHKPKKGKGSYKRPAKRSYNV